MRSIVVADVMTRDVTTASEDTPFKELVRLLSDKGISGIPVVDRDGLLIGIVTEADLLRVEDAERPRSVFLEWLLHPERLEGLEALSGDVRARDLMTRDVVAVTPETPLPEAVKLLFRSGMKRLPVTDSERRVVGIVTRRDLLRPYLRSDKTSVMRSVRTLSGGPCGWPRRASVCPFGTEWSPSRVRSIEEASGKSWSSSCGGWSAWWGS